LFRRASLDTAGQPAERPGAVSQALQRLDDTVREIRDRVFGQRPGGDRAAGDVLS
jgi:hypothetical protein